MAALQNGETLQQAAARCNVDPSTAFRWRHRFLAAIASDRSDCLTELTGADAANLLATFEDKRHHPKGPHKLGRKPRRPQRPPE
jgi:transposase-like protein